ncbi:MAG: hypothetical protein ABI810_04475 [Sphingomonas bacterium]
MIDRSFATRDRALSAPNVPEPASRSTIVLHHSGASGSLRRPLALWVYVARGLGRIILSVLALPFV